MEVQKEAGEKAPRKRGDLASSITRNPPSITTNTDSVIVGTNKVYARIHEYGGTIVPKVAKMLAWKVNGQWVFAHKVTIPPHPYLIPAYEKVKERLSKIFDEEFAKIMKRK